MNYAEIKEIVLFLFEPRNLYCLGTLLTLFLILILIRRKQPKSIVAYQTDNGVVTISKSAVVELVRTSCEQLEQVSKPNLSIFTKRGRTHFTIRIQLSNGSRLKDVEHTLQTHLRESLSENLGIENLGDINIIVTSFKSGRIRPLIDALPAKPVRTFLPAESIENIDESDPEKKDDRD